LVKLLDIEISGARLALRVLIALFLSALSLTVLYIAPITIMNYLNGIPSTQLQSLMRQLLVPTVVYIGLIVSALVLITVTLRKTRLEGPILIGLGVFLLAYWYIIFHGGTLTISIPVTEIQQALGYNVPVSIAASVTVNLTTLMLASMLTPLIIIVKGALLTAERI